jgi:chaperonin GroES
MSNKKIKPIGGKILVKLIEEQEQTKGGIIIPDAAKEKPQEAEVLELGTGAKNEKGDLIPFAVKVGDRVLFSKYGGTEVKVDDQKYMILREEDVLAILS